MSQKHDQASAVWLVNVEDFGPVVRVGLTFLRLQKDGTAVKFDEDPNGVLDLDAEEDQRIVADGLLALIPNEALVSCALRDFERVLLIWERMCYRHVHTGTDRLLLDSVLEGRLWNADSSADFLFAGGAVDDHTPQVVDRWTQWMREKVLGQPWDRATRAVAAPLEVYAAVGYTRTTEVNVFLRNGAAGVEHARQKLAAVAAKYGMRIPSARESEG